MAHDEWRAQLRIHAGDPAKLAALLSDLPVDGLQHAGNAIVSSARERGVRPVTGRLINALTKRDWEGDSELAAALQSRLDGTASPLKPLPVEPDQLMEALDQSGGAFLLNLETGMVWPGQLLEYGEEPPDYDEDDPGPWESFSPLESGAAFADMERFVATIGDPAIVQKLEDALHGRGAFRRFRDTLSRYPEHFTAWHRFSDDAQLGRARAWLANEGFRPVDG